MEHYDKQLILNAADRLAIMETMAANLDIQDDPKVGIFWYDPKTKKLFGVYKADTDMPFNSFGKRTIRTLHKAVWKKEAMKKTPGFQGDYTLIPRGRIFEEKDKGFVLYAGNWINCPDKPHILSLIKEEFDLQDFALNIDEHWDIGHGWSE